MKESFQKNLMELHGRLSNACEKYERDTDDITVVAVTKTHSESVINMAVSAGLHNIGESRIQEAEEKFNKIGHIARYHMIGHLQSNKAKKAVELFNVIQSVDSIKLAKIINKESEKIDRTIDCLIQVNCSGETQKSGISPDQCIDLVKQVNILPSINLIGLMTIGPYVEDEEQIRESYRLCNELFKQGKEIIGNDFDTLSMGMSNDFELAIAEGANMIRIGSSLFGIRE
ncbi:MAG: YggS family pyridoxal phosphate-dependent enzyme [Candidatus Zixiibacteriota bacterium]|nr:MAG: YggS family pyridoxal phosphate-dependent enzyme [candidate division Zixibacteria bacterium]